MAEGARVICLKLCVALLLFFVVYYMVASLLSGAFKLSNFDGKIPFDFESCCSVEDDKQMVTLLSLLLTYIITTGIYVIFLKRQIWDYAITVGLFHLAMSCAVMQAFPTNWQWWIAFLSSVVFMALFGELLNRSCFNRLQEQWTAAGSRCFAAIFTNLGVNHLHKSKDTW